jgi:hypothetical protein
VSSTRQFSIVFCGVFLAAGAQAQSPRKLALDDLNRLREVSAPEISPDGAWVAPTP